MGFAYVCLLLSLRVLELLVQIGFVLHKLYVDPALSPINQLLLELSHLVHAGPYSAASITSVTPSKSGRWIWYAIGARCVNRWCVLVNLSWILRHSMLNCPFITWRQQPIVFGRWITAQSLWYKTCDNCNLSMGVLVIEFKQIRW